MADIKTPEERSRNMSHIKGKDTKPEVFLRKMLFAKDYRYRNNYSKEIGYLDIWLGRYNTAIFVHGCFWHRHVVCRLLTPLKAMWSFGRKGSIIMYREIETVVNRG